MFLVILWCACWCHWGWKDFCRSMLTTLSSFGAKIVLLSSSVRLKTHFRALRVVNTASEITPGWQFCPADTLLQRFFMTDDFVLHWSYITSTRTMLLRKRSFLFFWFFAAPHRGHIGAASVTVQPPWSRNSDSESGFPVWRNDLLIPSSRKTTHKRTNA